MKTWRWFVGQVARLRRSIVGVFARDAERRRETDDHFDVADEPGPGPPAHWVERVRRGAPGLLEPSLRRRDEAVGAPVPHRAVSSQSEPEPRPRSLEEPERDTVPPELPVAPPSPEAQAPAHPRLLRKVLRRERPASPAEVEASPAPTADHDPGELHAAKRRSSEKAQSPPRESPLRESLQRRRLETQESPAAKPADRRRPLDDNQPTPVRSLPVRPSPPGTDVADRHPQPAEVIEFEAPAQRQTAQVEPAASPVEPIRADAARPRAPAGRQAELAVDEIRPDRIWEPNVPSPAPKRESNVERLLEPAVPRPASQRGLEPPAEPGVAPRRPAEPLASIEKHPWPELPPPLDRVDSDVEAALRAWAHQQRIDHEQTRL